jgi:hypothetical protein
MKGVVSNKDGKTYYPLPYSNRGTKLTGESLRNYQQQYFELYGVRLPDNLSITTKLPLNNPNCLKSKIAEQLSIKTELELAKEITWLASQTNYKLNSEVWVSNIRYDFVHIQPHKIKRKVVTIYELKKDIVTYDDIRDKVLDKQYLEKAIEYYGPHVRLVFIAPKYTTEAKAWDKDNAIEVQTLKEFTTFLNNKVRGRFVVDSFISK